MMSVEFALTMTNADNDHSSNRSQLKEIELFKSRDGKVFADVYEGGIRKTWSVQTKQFSQWLARKYFETTKLNITSAQLRATVNQIDAEAQVGSPEREVFRRVGRAGERLYFDLADELWRAIEIDASGWRVVQSPAVRFVRTP